MSSLLIDRCIIRVQEAGNSWHDVSLRGATHRQFYDWATLWFQKHLGRYLDLGPLETTPEEREQVLKLMVEKGIAPLLLQEGEHPDG